MPSASSSLINIHKILWCSSYQWGNVVDSLSCSWSVSADTNSTLDWLLGEHSIFSVQSPGPPDFSWSWWCSALLQKSGFLFLWRPFKRRNILVQHLWKVRVCEMPSTAWDFCGKSKKTNSCLQYPLPVLTWEHPFAFVQNSPVSVRN